MAATTSGKHVEKNDEEVRACLEEPVSMAV